MEGARDQSLPWHLLLDRDASASATGTRTPGSGSGAPRALGGAEARDGDEVVQVREEGGREEAEDGEGAECAQHAARWWGVAGRE